MKKRNKLMVQMAGYHSSIKYVNVVDCCLVWCKCIDKKFNVATVEQSININLIYLLR